MINVDFMITVQFVVSVTTASILAAILWYFLNKNKEIKQEHLQRVLTISRSISINEKQINFRTKTLQEYNFLKYNLDESLIVQAEIKLI